jgi:excisionase family DNA binding protein
MDEPKLLTLREVSEWLNVPPATLYDWRKDHKGPPGFRVGQNLRYERAAVERWLDEQRAATLVPRDPAA